MNYLKHWYQRIKYGYSVYDIQNFDMWFYKVIPEMLLKLSNRIYSYPLWYTEVYRAFTGVDPVPLDGEWRDAAFENYLADIRRVASLLYEANESTSSKQFRLTDYYYDRYGFEHEDKELGKKYWELMKKEAEEVLTYREECKKEALKVLSELLDHLYL